jgi:hypothetical protein
MDRRLVLCQFASGFKTEIPAHKRRELAPWNFQLLAQDQILGLKPRSLRKSPPDSKQQLGQKRDHRPLSYLTPIRASSRIRFSGGTGLASAYLESDDSSGFQLLGSRCDARATIGAKTEHENINPWRVGKKLITRGRIADKYIKRGLEYVVIESGRDGSRGGIARIAGRQTNSRSNGCRQTGLWRGFRGYDAFPCGAG